MARLIVEAVTSEWTSGDQAYTVLVGVSVSRADDGAPVAGLDSTNFRVASPIQGIAFDYKVSGVYEAQWEPADVEPSGCYQLEIMQKPTPEFFQGTRYVFGIQVRTFGPGRPPKVIDQGQTIVELISAGT
jgi:hypothetical protein